MAEGLSRRAFLAGAAVVLGACGTADRTQLQPGTPVPPARRPGPTPSTTSLRAGDQVEPIEAPTVELRDDPFALGVGSGDPTATSVVLWTRLMGADLAEEVPLVWEVSTSEDFETLVATEQAQVHRDDAHTIRAVVSQLPAAARLWYRFRLGRYTSPTGRTKTLPGPGDRAERLRLAVSSCQRFEAGYYAAHGDIAEAEVDFVLWLGDFVYETTEPGAVEARSIVGEEPTTLAGYRDRYARYRSDPQLQAAQAAHPWVSTWDDHEVDNDYDASVDPQRQEAAYRAWWEHTATRLPRPEDDRLGIYRSVDHGDLARVCLVDVRQYQDGSTLLGAGQRRWLKDQLGTHQRWVVLASPVLFGGLVSPLAGSEATLLPYSWDAYPEERAEVAELLVGRDAVIVSGDLHTSMVLDIKARDADGDEVTATTEFMAPAISSGFIPALAPLAPQLPNVNPQVRAIEVANGWMLLDIGAEGATVEFRFVDDIDDPRSTISVGRRYRMHPGDPYAEEL